MYSFRLLAARAAWSDGVVAPAIKYTVTNRVLAARGRAGVDARADGGLAARLRGPRRPLPRLALTRVVNTYYENLDTFGASNKPGSRFLY